MGNLIFEKTKIRLSPSKITNFIIHMVKRGEEIERQEIGPAQY